MVPSNTTSSSPSPSAAPPHTGSQEHGVGVKTGIGIIFALSKHSSPHPKHTLNSDASVCFAVITGVFLTKRCRDILDNRTSPWLGTYFINVSYRFLMDFISERLKRLVRCLQRARPVARSVNNQAASLDRRPTFPPLASRSSTFDQHLPPYTTQDPLLRSSQI